MQHAEISNWPVSACEQRGFTMLLSHHLIWQLRELRLKCSLYSTEQYGLQECKPYTIQCAYTNLLESQLCKLPTILQSTVMALQCAIVIASRSHAQIAFQIISIALAFQKIIFFKLSPYSQVSYVLEKWFFEFWRQKNYNCCSQYHFEMDMSSQLRLIITG